MGLPSPTSVVSTGGLRAPRMEQTLPKSSASSQAGPCDAKSLAEVSRFAFLVSSYAGGPFMGAQLAVTCRAMCTAVLKVWEELARNWPMRIYVIGGLDTAFQEVDTFWRLDPQKGVWEALPPSGLPAAGSAMTVALGKVYLFGGELSGDALQDARCFDPVAREWETLPPMKQGRIRPASVFSEGYIYVLGGLDGIRTLNSAERFNVATKTWEELPPMHRPRYAGGAAAVRKGCVLAMAGELTETGLAASLEVYNPKTSSWELWPAVRTPTCGATVVISRAGRTVYSVGGLGLSGQALAITESIAMGPAIDAPLTSGRRFSPPSWNSISSMATPRHLTSATTFGGGVAVIGGKGPTFEAVSSAEIYEPSVGAWKALPNIPAPRLRAAVVSARI
mmetsp:Transcript_3237/g.7682  ORF Transcript_3237/g.7682 Transcript_3237/m.7682 type:complete len:392 (-) Transcript_3237:423-1598(-)